MFSTHDDIDHSHTDAKILLQTHNNDRQNISEKDKKAVKFKHKGYDDWIYNFLQYDH